MDKLKLSNLESLLKFPGNPNPNLIISDSSVLTCGCLVSESIFLSSFKNICPNCRQENVSILTEIQPLRELYNAIQQLNSQLSLTQSRRRRSSSRKSIKPNLVDSNRTSNELNKKESMDLISLFYKFAKEEELNRYDSTDNSKTQPIEMQPTDEQQRPQKVNSTSRSPSRRSQQYPIEGSYINQDYIGSSLNFEKDLLKSLGEEKEYNFSKCFPFHRKLSTYPTQQLKFNLASITQLPFKSGSVLKKSSRFIGSDIHTYIDFNLGKEITRFVLITEKRWELYEYVVSINELDNSNIKPQLICCGKSTGEYGEDFNSLKNGLNANEIIIKNDFNQSATNNSNSNNEDVKKRLQQWNYLYCKLSANYLLISGTKGIMRLYNVVKSGIYELGQPIYTYLINFPIRCISIAPNDSLVGCGITARERLSDKEQPFIILHKLNFESDNRLLSVEPITITLPYRDPIKLISFNSTSTHLLCCTIWESRYLIIKLKSHESSDNYRKPRLIWADSSYLRNQRRHISDNENDEIDESVQNDNELMMANEGITDLQFGSLFSNIVVLTSCSLKNRPPIIIRLYGTLIDSKKKSSSISDNFSIQNSLNSLEDDEFSNIKSSEILMKIPEVGSLIHKFALSPRGDGIVFLNKDGNLYLVSTPDFQLNSNNSSSNKKIIVLLGEIANAERFNESASIKFSSDGGKVFTVDRKGIFSVFDFTKGVPGQDSDVVKCKILNV